MEITKYFNAERILLKTNNYYGAGSFNSGRLRKRNAYFYTQKPSLYLQTAFLQGNFVNLDAFCHLEEMTKFQTAHGYRYLMQNENITRYSVA